MSGQNLLIRDIAQSRKIAVPTTNWGDIPGFGGDAGFSIDGGGVIEDLLSLETIVSTADSPTTVMCSDSCT